MAKLSMFFVIFLIKNGHNYSIGDKQNTVNDSDLSIISKDGEIKIETNNSANEDILNTQRDTVVMKTVDEFKKLCPLTQLCSGNTTDIFTPNPPCCMACRCDEGCGTDCCPDKPRQYLNETQIRDVLDKTDGCIHPQYKPISPTTFNSEALNFIIKCPPSFTDQSIEENCARDYFDFIFVNGLFGFTPVSSNLTQHTYRNIYCARCHGENDSDLVTWQIKLDCSSSQPFAIQGPSDIPNALNSRDDCNLLFESPQESTKPSVCSPIEQCNITGLWKDYNAETEKACLSYRSNYKGHKNIHCYLCNGGKVAKVKTVCPVFFPINYIAFGAILDFRSEEFRGLGSSKSYSITTCPENSVYDRVRDKCRTLFCSKGLNLNDGKCQPIYKSFQGLGGATFGISFAATPRKIIHTYKNGTNLPKVNTLRDMMNCFTDDSEPRALTHNTDIKVCSRKTIVKANNTLKETSQEQLQEDINDTENSGVELIIFDIVFKAYFVQNTSKIISALAMVVSNKTANFYSVAISSAVILNNKSGNHSVANHDDTVCPKYNDDNDNAIYYSGNYANYSDDNDDEIYYSGNYANYSDETEYSNKRKRFLPIPPKKSEICESIIHIQYTDPFCAILELNADEYTLTEDGTSRIHLKYIDSHINIYGNVILKTDNSGIFLCHELYLKLSNAYTTKIKYNERKGGPLQILSIICLSISLLALLITFIVYCMLKSLWTVPGLNIMALVLSFIVMYALTLLSECIEINTPWLCSLVGMLKHFATLSSFSWMFICTFHMMTVFKAIQRETSRKTYIFLKYAISANTTSALIVLITITTSYSTSDESDIGYGGQFCYVDPAMILYTIFIPVCMVVVANIVMFVFVVVTICKLPDMRGHSTNERNNLMIFAKLSSLTGITWLIGIIYVLSRIDILAYINVVLNASQGVFIMTSFILNKRVHNMLREKFGAVTERRADTGFTSTKRGTGTVISNVA